MAKVKNLIIKPQAGTDNTVYATWEFDGKTTVNTPSQSSGVIRVGDWVNIKPGSTYYNGVAIPSWVMNQAWHVIEVIGNRAVIHENRSGTNAIMSPIHVNNLIGGSGGSSSGGSSTTTESISTLDKYDVKWYYDSGNGVWFNGGSSSNSEGNLEVSTYNVPSNALIVRVIVTPVAKTHKVNDTETPYWTGTSAEASYTFSEFPPEVPSVPTVTIDKYALKATIENIADPRSDQIEFQVYDGEKLRKSGIANVVTARASFQLNVEAGGDYRVRARSINIVSSGSLKSNWSNFSSSVIAVPATPNKMTICRATSETSVYLEWPEVSTAETYDIEYTNKVRYFDNSSETTTKTGIEFNHFEVTGLESGEEYFFRVRGVNKQGTSGWSEISSVIIGKEPAAPTTWSSATTVITGNPLNLYWVHNSEDGSSQTYGEIELYINGVKETYTIKNSEDEDEKDKTSVYSMDTSKYLEGTKIQWRVRTAGITMAYGDWSIQRTIDIYAPPTLDLKVTDVDGSSIALVTEFPFYINALAGPKTQEPIGYHVTISANSGYETVDYLGNKKYVVAGQAVYSKYFDTNDPLVVEFLPGNIDLENNVEYTVTVTVSMNSGLTGEDTTNFGVEWTDSETEPDAQIAVDTKSYVAYITPYCMDLEGNLITNVYLSVYRREYDGSYVELATGIDAIHNTVITDPHPALDYARYRIVAITKDTGSVSFYDPPGYPVKAKSIIIQWDEDWTNFDAISEDAMEEPPWAGSMLQLPGNIDVSDNHAQDVSLVKYIGRRYPVSYYGTQVDTTASWNLEIPKDDRETLYALRRLAIWMGDAYVREPSGSGYWANVKVSFSQKHCEVTIPVSLDITRVSGGV